MRTLRWITDAKEKKKKTNYYRNTHRKYEHENVQNKLMKTALAFEFVFLRFAFFFLNCHFSHCWFCANGVCVVFFLILYSLIKWQFLKMKKKNKWWKFIFKPKIVCTDNGYMKECNSNPVVRVSNYTITNIIFSFILTSSVFFCTRFFFIVDATISLECEAHLFQSNKQTYPAIY